MRNDIEAALDRKLAHLKLEKLSAGYGPFLAFNAGGRRGKMAEGSADDVKYVGALLDDLATVINVDTKRVFATGISNGGMMCYRLAAEMSDRIAAIARHDRTGDVARGLRAQVHDHPRRIRGLAVAQATPGMSGAGPPTGPPPRRRHPESCVRPLDN